jgi:hypothetical protein
VTAVRHLRQNDVRCVSKHGLALRTAGWTCLLRCRVTAEATSRELNEYTVRSAWLTLPAEHRALLQTVGADQWRLVNELLGAAVLDLLRSAGSHTLSKAKQVGLNNAVGVWIPGLRVVLINESHQAFAGLNTSSREAFLARVAWHEWGHALSVARCSPEDIGDGARLLDLAPAGISASIRTANYRKSQYTHELIAEIYALLMARRLCGVYGQPSWLHSELQRLISRTTNLSD